MQYQVVGQLDVGSQPGNMVVVVMFVGVGERAKLARGNSARSAIVDGYAEQRLRFSLVVRVVHDKINSLVWCEPRLG